MSPDLLALNRTAHRYNSESSYLRGFKRENSTSRMSKSADRWKPVDVDHVMDEIITIHGRVFQKHAVENDIQYLPIDSEERNRLEVQQKVFHRIFDEKLVFAPVNHLKNVLDLGCGSGAWAISIAQLHPDCNVTGVDISYQMLPDEAPENFWPRINDLNKPFTDASNKYDLVASRAVGAGINKERWPSYIRDIKRILKHGGWCQIVEYYQMAQSDNGSLTESHALREWSKNYMQAIETLKDPRAPMQIHSHLDEAGFIETESRMIPVPLSGWSKSAREKQIGEMQGEIVSSTLRSLSLYPLRSKLGMTFSDFDDLITRACDEASDLALKIYFPLYVCIGRKPPQ